MKLTPGVNPIKPILAYVTVVTIVGDVENYVTVVLSWIRQSVTFEDMFQLH